MCRYNLEAYPNEQIEYVKFLDDNDPSLLLVVTYDFASQTSYMKVMKIQQLETLAGSPKARIAHIEPVE